MRKSSGAFTLIEIMIVVVLISLLAGLVSTKLISKLEGARRRTAKAAVKSVLPAALSHFYLDTNRYPTTDEGLGALVEKPAADDLAFYDEEGYAEKDQLRDPWDRPYQYQSPGTHNPLKFDLWSAGKDGQTGTEDDIGNW